MVEVKNILPITQFAKVYRPTKKGLYRVALYDFLSDVAYSCNYTEIHAPDSVNIDELALDKLIQWALGGFVPNGPPRKWKPTELYLEMESGQGNEYKIHLGPSKVDERNPQCVACQGNTSQHPHPLFEGYHLCQTCLEDFSQCAFLFGEDGTGLLHNVVKIK